jgi:hypothetical protein
MRAKFRCSRVEEIKGTPWREPGAPAVAEEKMREEVELWAVTGAGANESWAKATPGGYLRMTIDNPSAWGHFAVGGEYYLDFSASEPKAA